VLHRGDAAAHHQHPPVREVLRRPVVVRVQLRARELLRPGVRRPERAGPGARGVDHRAGAPGAGGAPAHGRRGVRRCPHVVRLDRRQDRAPQPGAAAEALVRVGPGGGGRRRERRPRRGLCRRSLCRRSLHRLDRQQPVRAVVVPYGAHLHRPPDGQVEVALVVAEVPGQRVARRLVRVERRQRAAGQLVDAVDGPHRQAGPPLAPGTARARGRVEHHVRRAAGRAGRPEPGAGQVRRHGESRLPRADHHDVREGGGRGHVRHSPSNASQPPVVPRHPLHDGGMGTCPRLQPSMSAPARSTPAPPRPSAPWPRRRPTTTACHRCPSSRCSGSPAAGRTSCTCWRRTGRAA
jgi:hypothetical protein